jgi:positive regulator of sigma E activity
MIFSVIEHGELLAIPLLLSSTNSSLLIYFFSLLFLLLLLSFLGGSPFSFDDIDAIGLLFVIVADCNALFLLSRRTILHITTNVLMEFPK